MRHLILARTRLMICSDTLFLRAFISCTTILTGKIIGEDFIFATWWPRKFTRKIKALQMKGFTVGKYWTDARQSYFDMLL